MAGYSRLYCIGDEGLDGINPILFQVLVGDADRQWLEVHYHQKGLEPLHGITRLVPAGPNDPAALIDACILFYPDHFRTCLSFGTVERQITTRDGLLDFNIGHQAIPAAWAQLREEARAPFSQLSIWEAKLKQIQRAR